MQWAISVDHKKLALMYIGAGLCFFLVAGLEAAFMRLQLARAENDVIDPETFNQLFTMHGTTMVFLVGMPILLGFGNYLIPLMVGARDMAFPRLNAFGFWLFIFGGLLLYFSYLGADGLYGAGTAPDVGWFAYAPLTSRTFSRGNSTDYWILGIMVSGFGSMTTAINFIATILCMRCPGMTLMRMPMIGWMMLVVAFLVLVAIPILTGAQIMLLLDRTLGAHFFDPETQGSAILWQHLFWFFGHPEVYILILPAFGFVSEIMPTFSRKVLFGYPLMVAATVGIGFISLGVWAHHMFVVGLGPVLDSFFGATTFLISVPTGIKIFNWLGTMWGGRLHFTTPMLFVTGFVAMFVIGGLTGIMLATVPLDLAALRQLLRGGALPLRPLRRHGVRNLRRDLLLVPEGDRTTPRRTTRQVDVLAAVHRLHADLHADARLRGPRHAASHLHLRGRSRMGDLESDQLDRRAGADGRRRDLPVERDPGPASRPGGR